jgi:FKBP-type peptidyl-prolyl cis-trans isomerase SlyD
MTIGKNDFVEIEFLAKADGQVFDTNIKEEAEKAQLNIKNFSPLVIAVGAGMVIAGLDKELEGKEFNKKYNASFSPEQAFGKRDSKLVRMIPLKVFIQQKIMPEKGMQLSLDGMIVKVLSVSSGRVLVDFNNPLAGKQVSYEYTLKRKVEDIKEKINALQDFFFRTNFDFEVGENIVFKVDENVGKFIQIFEKQFEELIGKKIKIEAKPQKDAKPASE